jgi:hypothetical protein
MAKAKTIRIVRLPGLAEKGDVSDWLDADLPYTPQQSPGSAGKPADSWQLDLCGELE